MKFASLAAIALLAAPAALATEINVAYDPEFAEELADTYGEREGEYLTNAIQKDLNDALEKAGVDPARIEVTIIDARPNKPTFKQLADKPGLSYGDSISTGGMKLSAIVYDAEGNAGAELTYDWYENNIMNAGPATWYDAKKASDRFARKLVKQLKAGAPLGS